MVLNYEYEVIFKNKCIAFREGILWKQTVHRILEQF
jgi:hypothetical protein